MPRGGTVTPCSVDDCDSRIVSHGLCGKHWSRVKRRGTTEPYRGRGGEANPCAVEGCDRNMASHGMCGLHWKRFQRTGSTSKPVRTRTPFVDARGYVRIYVDGKRQAQLQHRILMEQHLGRSLNADETVHHKNGDRTDNRLSNLELWSTWQPSGQRVEDKVAWAVEILQRYGADEHIGRQLLAHIEEAAA